MPTLSSWPSSLPAARRPSMTPRYNARMSQCNTPATRTGTFANRLTSATQDGRRLTCATNTRPLDAPRSTAATLTGRQSRTSTSSSPSNSAVARQLSDAVSGAQRPVVADTGTAPRVSPLAGVAAEIDTGRRVADAAAADHRRLRLPTRRRRSCRLARWPMPNAVTGPVSRRTRPRRPYPRLP